MTLEGIRLKVQNILRKMIASHMKKKLNSTEFTIISNNCWGGMVYESYDIQKNSPTVGLYFMAPDYVQFLSDLGYYLKKEIKFISPEQSKYSEILKEKGKVITYPIGVIDDVEIFFLHYKSEKEAMEKWQRRIKRINEKQLLIKFCDQNGCTEKEVKKFLQLPYKNKIFFTTKDWQGVNPKYYIKVSQFGKKEYIKTSYEPIGINRYVNLTKLLNSL